MAAVFRAIALLALSAALTAVSAAAEPLRRGNQAEPMTLDPHKISTTYENEILRDVYVGLTTLNAKAEVVPGIAERWDIEDGGARYVFHLRRDAVWSDGAPVVADDAVLGLRRALDPATEAWFSSLLYKIENARAVHQGELPVEKLGVTALDPHTVEIRLTSPSPVILNLMANSYFAPAPSHLVASDPETWARPGTAIANGPFRIAEWRSNDHVRLEKNPTSVFPATGDFAEVRYYPTEDDSAALKRFRAGELDFNGRVPPNQLDWLRANLPEATRVYPASAVNYIVVNHRLKPFDDVRVRRALWLAIDRPTLTDRVTRTGERPVCALVPPAFAGYTPLVDRAMCEGDLEARRDQARTLLAEAGFGPGNPLRFDFNHRAGMMNKRVAVAVMDMWKQVGVEARIAQLEVRTHYAQLRQGDFVVADGGWSAQGDPEFYTYLLKSEATEVNYGAYSNPEYDRLVEAAEREMDMEKRYAMFAEAEKLALETDVAMIPLFAYSNTALVRPDLTGFEENGISAHPSRFFGMAMTP